MLIFKSTQFVCGSPPSIYSPYIQYMYTGGKEKQYALNTFPFTFIALLLLRFNFLVDLGPTATSGVHRFSPKI